MADSSVTNNVVSANGQRGEALGVHVNPLRDTGGMKWFSFFDPDGNRIDVMQNRPRPF
jgi:hypothetical protein